jgi:hypothetical protein
MWEELQHKADAQMTPTEKVVSDLLKKKASEQSKCESYELSDISRQAYLKVFAKQK